ncbi:DUF1835 domain-containing protein [Lysinibacillus sp. NPDC093712]|uniref:DUF1835 domain-containing protein n=1 Tax=Lysinibacillus sp. NPDC093712 TaxID=3390579 RepID=UPI003CFFDC75
MPENFIRMKEAIKTLSEAEAKSMLFLALLNGKSSEDIQQVILQMSEDKMKTIQAQTVHILFGDSPGGSLKAAFRNTSYQKTEDIIVLPDNLSIGPIKDLHNASGIEARLAWFQKRYNTEDDGLEHNRQRMLTAVEKINLILPHQNIVIWTCQNAHEQTGLRLVLAMLEGKLNTVRVIDTFTAFHEKNISPRLAEDNYPRTTGELNGETLLNFYEQFGMEPINNVKKQKLCDEGKRLLSDDVHIIRTWACEKLLNSGNEHRDDDFIIACAIRLSQEDGKVEYKKAARLIGEVIGHMQQYTGDEWIEYRVRCLIKQGVFSYRGDLKAMRFYEVKLLDNFLTDLNF